MDILQLIPTKDLALVVSLDMIILFGVVCLVSIITYLVFRDCLEYKKFIKQMKK